MENNGTAIESFNCTGFYKTVNGTSVSYHGRLENQLNLKKNETDKPVPVLVIVIGNTIRLRCARCINGMCKPDLLKGESSRGNEGRIYPGIHSTVECPMIRDSNVQIISDTIGHK